MSAAHAPAPARTVLALLRTQSLAELRHHPWRAAAAVVAVMLGVALALAVQLINASALSEFTQGMRSIGGEPDLELRATSGQFDDALFERIVAHPAVATASPVVDATTYLFTRDGRRLPLRLLGVDALSVAQISPGLLPAPAEGESRFSAFAAQSVFLNTASRALLESTAQTHIEVQAGLATRRLRVAGSVSAAGAPLAVMDIAAAQELLGWRGRISRIDLRLVPGASRAALLDDLKLGADVLASEPSDDARRMDSLSGAYRVNLTVLAFVALFTGAFLVHSVLALSVAQRSRQIALLGVLGLSARERLVLVLAESAALGLAGSVLGIALGTGLAFAALTVLGGDLGGGYFAGIRPGLQWQALPALGHALLGVAAAMAGGLQPARAAAALPPAQTLKGLHVRAESPHLLWIAITLVSLGVLAATLPAIGGVPLAAYLSVALLLLGGILMLPALIARVYGRLALWVAHRPVALLAVERARRQRGTAAVAVSGVVAALALAVALTVMVASFRESVTRWLDVVLPAELYVRSATSAAAADSAWFDDAFVAEVARVPGVARVGTLRTRSLLIDPRLPPVALIARSLDSPTRALPLVGDTARVTAPDVAIWVSEPVAELHGARVGEAFGRMPALGPGGGAARAPRFVVAGIWRDYGRQHGAIAIDAADYRRISQDTRVNDLALWLQTGADEAAVQSAVRGIAARRGMGEAAGGSAAGERDALLEFASATQIRAMSLRIFDRSFAVTYWLQAVAIGIGLFGVAASFSAQVLARRREFGLLTHLGLTRRQILTLVAGEGLAWSSVGALAGVVLGIAVSVVLVHVVNPQSFHWTMDLMLPVGRLLALALAVIAAGTLTAWLTGRGAARQDAVLAVKEDW